MLIDEVAAAIGVDRIVEPSDVAGRSLAPIGIVAPATVLVRPRSTQEVCHVMRLCNAANQPVIVVGGATGLAGGLTVTGNEWLLSLEAMRGIEIDATNRIALVDAGVVLQDLQDRAADVDLSFQLDIGARGSATVGGLVSTNAGGEKALRFGMMREQVLGLEVVLADGSRLDLMNRMIKNNTGYDLKQLFIGAEGTLGVVTRAALKLRPRLPSRHTALASTGGFDDVIRLKSNIERALGNDLTAFEVMWPRFYEIASRNRAGALPLPLGAGMYVLFEAEGGASSNDNEFLEKIEPVVQAGIVEDLVFARSIAERDAMWALRNNIPALIQTFMPIMAFDVSIPISEMGAFVATLEKRVGQRWQGCQMTAFGHLGDNNLHVVITLGADTGAAKDELSRLIYEEVNLRGGSISAEHGIGIEKRDYLSYCWSQEVIQVMRTLKALFDGNNIMNPGKLLLER